MIGTQADLSWKVVYVGDLSGDGKPDLLWRNRDTGMIAVWYMNGANYVSNAVITTANADWAIAAPR